MFISFNDKLNNVSSFLNKSDIWYVLQDINYKNISIPAHSLVIIEIYNKIKPSRSETFLTINVLPAKIKAKKIKYKNTYVIKLNNNDLPKYFKPYHNCMLDSAMLKSENKT